MQKPFRALILILAIAFILRLSFVVTSDPATHMSGGDTGWLLRTGLEIVEDRALDVPPSGPLFLVYAGIVQKIVGQQNGMFTLGVLNALMGTALCWFIYVLGERFFNIHIGLLTALIIAVNPIFVIEAGNILTESLFLFLMFGGLAIYATHYPNESRGWRAMIFIGILLGMATLTRAISMLLPVVLSAHLIYHYRSQVGVALKMIGMLALVYVLTLGTYTAYNLVRFNKFIIAASGVSANIYMGATGGWCGPECVDERAGIRPGDNNEEKYVEGAISTITADPVGYLRTRAVNLAESILQPHNTIFYPGESIKQSLSTWWANGRNPGELGQVFGSDYFWPKFLLYVFHFGTLVLGLIGALLSLRQIGFRLPIYGIPAYFIAIHFVLTAIPRYMFPMMPFMLLFASYATITILCRFRASAKPELRSLPT